MFVIISVIYRPIEQLLSRTIAERRARGHAEHSLRVPMLIQAGFALVFLALALALHDELVDHVFDHYSALYYVLVVGTLAYAASYFARGWLAGHRVLRAVRRPRADGVASRASASRSRSRSGSPAGRRRWRSASPRRRSSRWWSCPAAFARRSAERSGAARRARRRADHGRRGRRRTRRAGHRGRPGDRRRTRSSRCGAAAASRSSGPAIMLAEQTLLNAAVLTVDATSTSRALAGDRLQRPADRARAAAALPGDPDLAAAAPDGPGGDRGPRGVRPRDPRDRPRDRRLRARRSRSACWSIGPFADAAVFFGQPYPTAASGWR